MLPWKGGEFEPDFSLALVQYDRKFFGFEGFDGFKRQNFAFKRSLKVS